MGVERTDYLMLAVDVGYKAFDWEKHEVELQGGPTARFDIVFDGMSGEYCLAGKIIATSDAYEGFAKAIIDPDNLDIDRPALAAKIAEAFGKPVAASDLALVLFSHFH